MIKTELRRRDAADYTALLSPDRPELLCRLYAARGITSAEQLERGARGLLNYGQLNGIDQAVVLLKEALHQNQLTAQPALHCLSAHCAGWDSGRWIFLSPTVLRTATGSAHR